jgi:hypothetical protein
VLESNRNQVLNSQIEIGQMLADLLVLIIYSKLKSFPLSDFKHGVGIKPE